jgi:hypothetical protein
MNTKSVKPSTLALAAVGLTLLGLIATVIIQATSTAYAFGRLTNEVQDNRQTILIIAQQQKALESTDKQVAILRQKVVDDERLLHAIAKAVGATDGGIE